MTSETNEDGDTEDDLPDNQLNILEAVSDAASHRPTAAAYARGPDAATITDKLEDLLTHARRDIGYDLTDYLVTQLSEAPNDWGTGAGSSATNNHDGMFVVFDVNEDHPTGVERLINIVTEHGVEDVVTRSLGELGGIDESTRTVERLQDEDVTVHLVDDGLVISPDDNQIRSVLTAVRKAVQSDVSAPQIVTEQGTGIKWTGGQPPRGLTVNDSGYLERGEDWELIRSAAAAVENGNMTEYRASKVSGVSRHSIRTALDEYRDIYRVEEADPISIGADADDEQ